MIDKRPSLNLVWALYVDCPSCTEGFDASADDDDHIFSTAIFNNKWMDVPGNTVTCPHCKHEFEVGEVEY